MMMDLPGPSDTAELRHLDRVFLVMSIMRYGPSGFAITGSYQQGDPPRQESIAQR